MRTMLLAAALSAVCACSQQPGTPDAPATDAAAPDGDEPARGKVVALTTTADPTALGPRGLGDIVIGQAPPASLKADAAQVSDGCRTYTDKARRIYAMTDGKVVARITAMSGSPVGTGQGIAVGDSEAAVRKVYPDVTEEPHTYVEAPAKYLDWRADGGKTGLRFEIDKQGKVEMIHAGREPELEYVEGCA